MPLTQALAELVDTIGLTATVKLVRVYGARALYIPKHLDDRHEITLRIGREAADRLGAAYGGTQLLMPPECTLLVELREREIVRRIVQENQSIGSVAYAFGVSCRWVHRILDRAGHPRPGAERTHLREDPRQLRLWE